MKSKKTVPIICAVLIQAILLVFWGVLALETVCPSYKWTDSAVIVGSPITVTAPKRTETFLTSTAEKANNAKFTSACAEIQSDYIEKFNLTSAPEAKITEKGKDALVFELSSSQTSEKWVVSTSFGNANSFSISLSETGGDVK